jgi:hypothetical protein
MAADKNTKPFNPVDRSPTLVRLLKTRLAPVRERELMAKATSPERPVKPGPGDCCGSSCQPCVMDSYAEELRVWKECWVKWEGGDGEPATEKPEVVGETGGVGKSKGTKMPGAYDW